MSDPFGHGPNLGGYLDWFDDRESRRGEGRYASTDSTEYSSSKNDSRPAGRQRATYQWEVVPVDRIVEIICNTVRKLDRMANQLEALPRYDGPLVAGKAFATHDFNELMRRGFFKRSIRNGDEVSKDEFRSFLKRAHKHGKKFLERHKGYLRKRVGFWKYQRLYKSQLPTPAQFG